MLRATGFGAVVGVLACAAVVGAQAMQPERLIMVKEADKAAQKCRVLKCWIEKDGNKVRQVQAIDTGEMMTIVEEGVGPAPTASKALSPGTKVIHWGGQTTPPPIAPAPPPNALVVGTPKPPAKPSLIDRVFAASRPRVSKSKVTRLDPSKPTVVATKIAPPGKPKNWSDQWGTVERLKDSDADKAAESASAKAESVQPTVEKSAPVAKETPCCEPKKDTLAVKESGEPKKVKKDRPALLAKTVTKAKELPVEKTPVTTSRAPEEVKELTPAKKAIALPKDETPDLWTSLFGRKSEPAVVVKVEEKKPTLPPPFEIKKSDARPAMATPAPSAKDEPSLWARMTGIRRPIMPAQTQEPPPAQRMASRQAAMTTPPATYMGPRPISLPASTRNAFTVMVPGSQPMMQPPMMYPQMMPMYSEAGVPMGMNNAFTAGMSSRPIPADMTRTYDAPNGLQGPGHMGGAESRPPFAMAYYPPMMPPAMMTPYYPPATMPPVMQASAVQPSPSTQALQTLRDSVLPSEREMAVDQLRRCDWKQQPEVLDGLMKSATTDPAPMVRAACVRALGKMKANTVPVVSTVTALKDDTDIRVRQEVEQALPLLTK